MRTFTNRDLAGQQVVEETVYAVGGPKKIVVVIPGIRTNADWVDDARSQTQSMLYQPIEFRKSNHKRISTSQLITRLGLRRNRENIKDQISNLIIDVLGRNEDVVVSLLCHSLGTDMAADIVGRIDYKFEHIVLMGAVCSENKINILKRSCHTLVNIRGSLDQYPIMASILRPDQYDPTGTFGRGDINIINIELERNHSSCTEWETINQTVIPGLQTNTWRNGPVTNAFSLNAYDYSKNVFWYFIIISILTALYTVFSGSYLAAFISIFSFLISFFSVCQYFLPERTAFINQYQRPLLDIEKKE